MGIQAYAYSLRIDQELMEKIKIVATENSRSVNKEIEFAIKRHILNFEKDNGPITPSQDHEEE